MLNVRGSEFKEDDVMQAYVDNEVASREGMHRQNQRNFEIAFSDLPQEIEEVLSKSEAERVAFFSDVGEKMVGFSGESLKIEAGLKEQEKFIAQGYLQRASEQYSQVLSSVAENYVTGDKDQENFVEENYDFAVDFNAAYCAGEVWNAVPELHGEIKREDLVTAFRKIHRGTPLSEVLGPTILDKMRAYLEGNSWILSPLSRDPISVVTNLAGKYATEATVAYAKSLFPQCSEALLLETLDRAFDISEGEMVNIIAEVGDEPDPRWERVMLFALAAANLTWITYKPYQALCEHFQGVTKPGKGLDRVKPEFTKQFITFSQMRGNFGIDVLVKDKNQISVGLQVLVEKQQEKTV